jgi:hypothetical protein
VIATLDVPVKMVPWYAGRQVPGTQKRRRSSGIPVRERLWWYLRRSQRMIDSQAWRSTWRKAAEDTPWRKFGV